MNEIEPFATEGDALARLDQLREARSDAHAVEQRIVDDIKAVLAVAGGQPFDRSKLIEHSGMSRRTAYQVFPPKPAEVTDPE